jgi:hypothetical protein
LASVAPFATVSGGHSVAQEPVQRTFPSFSLFQV